MCDAALSDHGEKHLDNLVIEPVVPSEGEEVVLRDVNVMPAQKNLLGGYHGAGNNMVHYLGDRSKLGLGSEVNVFKHLRAGFLVTLFFLKSFLVIFSINDKNCI